MGQTTEVLGFVALGLGAGTSFVLQQAVNADLRTSLNSAAWAGFVSYLGGTGCMLALALLLREEIPSIHNILHSNWWGWTGGIFGAIYIAISICLVPRLGTATFVVLFVAGQMLSSLILDQYGLFGVTQHAMSSPQLLGAILLVISVVLIRA